MKDSILGPTGGQLTEMGMDANGNMAWSHTNVWAGGQLLATYDPNGLHFYLTDWLGSRRVQTDYEGVVEQTCANLPYGNGVTCGPNPAEELFAGLERDSESGLDHAMYRQYSSTFGQWTTPDPYAGSYDWTNPQSLNRYAYVNGSPLGAMDPSGLFPGFPMPCTPITAGDLCSAVGTFAVGSTPIPVVGIAVDLGIGIFELGKALGWWDVQPKFTGNVSASQSGKNVPNNSNKPCTCLDTGAFADTLDNNAMLHSIGKCAKYVRLALQAAGMVTTGHPVAGGNYGPFLQQHGFNPVSMNGYEPQTGDIDVFDTTVQHTYGHITGYDGNQWVSDYSQGANPNPYTVQSSAGNSTIYRNSCPCK
jgi:RHS repeat-associated protein